MTSPPGQYFGDFFPAFSPDGQTIAFIRSPAFQVIDIYVLAHTAGGTPRGEPRRLSFDERYIAGLDWTPDGREIVFASNRAGSYSLWRIAAVGGKPEPLVAGGDNAYAPSISRQGHLLAYTRLLVNMNIWRTRGPSSTGARGSAVKLISSTGGQSNPQFSPDGRKIVFSSGRSGNPEIWICDSEGLNLVQLTSFGGPPVGTPRWSHDGQNIAFDSAKEGHTEIYVIRSGGGAPHRITVGNSGSVRPSWSRDGRWIYFGSNRTGAWQVWKVPAEGGPPVQVTRKGGREAFESPDGKFVYYHKHYVPGIWRVAVEGGEETEVLDQGLQGHWAVLNDGICLLNRNAMPVPVIEFFSFATGRVVKLASLPREVIRFEGSFGIPSFAVSPDGQWILYNQADRVESNIMLVENFR